MLPAAARAAARVGEEAAGATDSSVDHGDVDELRPCSGLVTSDWNRYLGPWLVSAREAHDPKVLAQYEGLIFSTARRYAPFVDLELDDVQQILRVKVFKALLSYEPAKAAARTDGRDPRDTYVFQCVKNQAKDLLKKKPLDELFLEDVAPTGDTVSAPSRDRFENVYGLASTHEEVYGAIEDDDLVIPNTLTPLERRIICLLYAAYRQSEVARSLGLAKRDMERSMRSIRTKMGDWRPTGVVVVLVTDRPAPHQIAA